MVCCALAVFLIGQIYALYGAVKVRLGQRESELAFGASASAWRASIVSPGPLPARPRAAGRHRLRIGMALAISLFGLGVAAVVRANELRQPVNIQALLADPRNWCGSHFKLIASRTVPWR